MVYYVDTECMPRVVYWRGVRISRSGKQIMRRATTAAAATLASTPHPCLGVDFFSVTYRRCCNRGGGGPRQPDCTGQSLTRRRGRHTHVVDELHTCGELGD